MLNDELLKKYKKIKENPESDFLNVRSERDLLVTELTEDFWMIVSCDSDGGIGPKEQDTVHCSGYTLGRFAARVPLMEMVACGAIPVLVVDVLAVEMDPTGKEIIEGVRAEAEQAGMKKDMIVTGSTEDNVKTIQTGLGVVVIGIVKKEDFKPGLSELNDVVLCVGYPKSAPEDKIDFSDKEIANLETVRLVSKIDYIHDILPVGSKGIKYEFGQLAVSAGMQAVTNEKLKVDTLKSAGPTTCLLVTLPSEKVFEFVNEIDRPITKIGHLIKDE
jgi:AIR synthase related protein, N-terminal domain